MHVDDDARAHKKPMRNLAQLKQPLMEVPTDFEQTIVDKITDQWSKRLGAVSRRMDNT